MTSRSTSLDKQHPVSPPVIAWKRWTDGWLPEIVAAIFGVFCFLGLIILLYECEDKPAFDWHGITVNALVALLSTGSRASLMVALAGAIGQVKWINFARRPGCLYEFETVDVASRDAWGRLKLLWRSPFGLASLGAFGAVLGLAFDPFNQQLIATKVVVGYSNNSMVAIGRAQRYSSGTRLIAALLQDPPLSCNATNVQTPNLILGADFDMQAAILSGVGGKQFLNSTVQQLQPTCYSGNCTWPAFDSLAVCSQCYDVQSQLQQSSSDNLQYQQLTQSESGFSRFNGSTKFTLANGPWLETRNDWRWSGDSQNLSTVRTTLMASYGTTDPAATLSFQDYDTLIWSMTTLRVRPRQPNAQEILSPYLPEASECALFYCVNTYTSTVVNGIVQEKETRSRDSVRDPASWQLIPRTNPGYKGPVLTDAQSKGLGGGTCVQYPDRTDLRLGTSFNISQSAVSTISSFVNATFAVADRAEASRGKQNDALHDIRRLNGFGVSSTQVQWQPAIMKPIFESDDLALLFQRVARSMTNTMRTNSDNDTVTLGMSGAISIHVSVNWPWIALPAVVLVITVIQVIMSMIATGTSGAPVWKSSSLATFSRGNYIPESIKAASLVSAMERIGKKGAPVDLFANERHESHAKPAYTTSFGREKKREYTTIRTVA